MTDHDQRSLTPTVRRRQEARASGRVAVSHDLSAAVAWIAATAGFAWLGSATWDGLQQIVRGHLQGQAWRTLDRAAAVHLWYESVGQGGRAVAPFIMVCLLLATVARLAQVGVLWAPARLLPRAERLHPAHALARIFSWASLYTLLAGSTRWLGAVGLTVWVWWTQRHRLLHLVAVDPRESGVAAAEVVTGWAWQVGLLLLALGILDYIFQRWQFERDLQMSPAELRAEIKAIEGNSQVSAGRRDLARALKRAEADPAGN